MTIVLSCLCLLIMVCGLHAVEIPVIPLPEKVQVEKGEWSFSKKVLTILAEGEIENDIVKRELSAIMPGRTIQFTNKTPANFIIKKTEGFEKEAYSLQVTKDNIKIEATDDAGIFYALKTLAQLIKKTSKGWQSPIVDIRDKPAFPIRGFMHDTGRNFQTVESLKKQLDIFATFKLNVFHWHLTDHPAWRPQSKIFPVLNTEKGRNPLRDPDKNYSFDEIRSVIAYAKARHIQIIPELDMPGHSSFFKPAFGYIMGSPQGIETLKKLIKEFCDEIPASDCPILHIGSDEVHIKEPAKFMKEIEDTVIACGRIPMIWAPGLKATNKNTILQYWTQDREIPASAFKNNPNPIIDTTAGYLNLFDPQMIVQRHYYHPACSTSRATEKALGAILCHWPDVRVDDKTKIFSHSPVWPAVLAFSESLWRGRENPNPAAKLQIPPAGDPAFDNFEKRMTIARERFMAGLPFDYIPMHRHTWRITEDSRLLRGSAFLFSRYGDKQMYSSKVGQKFNLTTTFTLDTPRTVHFRVGFDSPGRSNHYSGGIPPADQLDSNGGDVFLNGKPLPRPKYKNPGKFRIPFDTWNHKLNDVPFIDEEFFWLREPIAVTLPAGTHTLQILAVQALPKQAFAASCLPVKKTKYGWVDDETITFKVAE